MIETTMFDRRGTQREILLQAMNEHAGRIRQLQELQRQLRRGEIKHPAMRRAAEVQLAVEWPDLVRSAGALANIMRQCGVVPRKS